MIVKTIEKYGSADCVLSLLAGRKSREGIWKRCLLIARKECTLAYARKLESMGAVLRRCDAELVKQESLLLAERFIVGNVDFAATSQ